MPLAPVEQSIQLFIGAEQQLLLYHTINYELCHCYLKSWKKVWPLFFLSLITSHAISTSRAEHTTSYRGRATTSFRSYHQLKTCYLKTINLNLGRRCGQTEIVCHWSLLMSLELAEHSIQLLTCHISNEDFVIVHNKTTNPNLEKKCDLCFFCHWSLLMPLAPLEQSIQLLCVS